MDFLTPKRDEDNNIDHNGDCFKTLNKLIALSSPKVTKKK